MNDMVIPTEASGSQPEPSDTQGTTPAFRESAWKLRHITLAGLSWPSEPESHDNTPILMLHGWLDNSLTFVKLAPELTSLGPVYALDFAGHGHSGHRPEGQSYLLMDYVADLAELVERYFQETPHGRINIIGHSLGGIVGALYAAAFPERVQNLVMIDSLVPSVVRSKRPFPSCARPSKNALQAQVSRFYTRISPPQPKPARAD